MNEVECKTDRFSWRIARTRWLLAGHEPEDVPIDSKLFDGPSRL